MNQNSRARERGGQKVNDTQTLQKAMTVEREMTSGRMRGEMKGAERTVLGAVPGKSIKNPNSASPCRSQRETGNESGGVQEAKGGRGRGRGDIGVSCDDGM